MKRHAYALAIALLTSISVATYAAETPNVVEAFTCDYVDGKGPADLSAAIDFWNAQIDKIDDENLNAYGAGVLTPLRANLDADFIWIGGSGNLNATASALNASMTSKEGQAAGARFDEISDCDSNLHFSTPIYVGTPPDGGGDDAIIELFGCTLNAGRGMADVETAEKHFAEIAKAAEAGINVYRWTPFLANTPYDLAYVGVHANLGDWGAFNTNMITSEDGQENGALFANAMDCESGLFTGQSARTPPN